MDYIKVDELATAFGYCAISGEAPADPAQIKAKGPFDKVKTAHPFLMGGRQSAIRGVLLYQPRP
jgi:hypothetical protein